MDKTMKRVIGYQPNKPIQPKKEALPKTETSEPSEKEKPVVGLKNVPDIIKDKSKRIVDWINSHKEFKWGAMCAKLKIDKSNFQRVLNADEPKIKIEDIPKIEDFLKLYGYAG